MSTMTAVVNSHDHDIGSQAGRDIAPQAGRESGMDSDLQQRNADFTRAASYTFMPTLAANQAYNRQTSPITLLQKASENTAITLLRQGSLSEDDLIDQPYSSADVSPPESSGWTTPSDDLTTHIDSAKDLVAELHKSQKITDARNTDTDTETETETTENETPTISPMQIQDAAETATPVLVSSLASTTTPDMASLPTSNRLSASFAKRLSRRLSSTPSSRDPSPNKKSSFIKDDTHPSRRSSFIKDDAHPSKRSSFIKDDSHEQETAPNADAAAVGRKRTVLRKRDSHHNTSKENRQDKQESREDKSARPENEDARKRGNSNPGLLSRSTTMLRRKSFRSTKAPKSEQMTARASMEMSKSRPSVPALPTSFSTDRLPLSAHAHHERPVPVPLLSERDRTPSIGALSLPRKRDELWGVFRSLDGDYTKFQSKSSALKANVVRTSLLPFLRNYADHPSSFSLRSEDLDRRANILNKWWTALIEMLHGKNNQSISGTDRPAILDGLLGIMERPEWRLSPSPFCPLMRRSCEPTTARKKSSASLASSGLDFLTESVNHSVRNMFVQNLNAQMAFVVDRMSLRNASASLVTFCGKATAYAFFFCPGIAEVLVRLWDTPTDLMRRVLEENGVGKFDNLAEISANIVSAFPPAIHALGFTSLGKTLKHLRSHINLPLGTANIQWYGFWLERWLGRESDLFYAFVKQFHMLVTDYLPPESTKKEHMCVPGLLLVHAQILYNLDSTIHRDAGSSQGDGPAGLPATLDDVLADPDAVASTIPLPPTNAIRIMAENRLIMLIRDFLSERSVEHPRARQLFAVSFNDLLQACARKTSIYDHSACYTLCDLLEEALLILVRYEHLTGLEEPLINSKFWLEVCKQMINSQNTMTEIRLYAFLYTVWNIVTSDATRKADLCIGLLLDEAIFERTFNHWCPMVRAYYMRLLCWRVGRYDGSGEESPQDRLILETLLSRLRSVWSWYLWLKQEAGTGRAMVPSTIPCNPAPGRRLLIIRTDTAVPSGGSFLAFDGFAPPNPSALDTPGVPWKRHTTLSPVVELDSRPNSVTSSDTDSDVEKERGVRGFLRSILGGSSSSSRAALKSREPSPRVFNRLSVASVASALPVANTLIRSATDDPRARSQSPSSSDMSGNTMPSGPRHRSCSFKFSLECYAKQHGLGPMRLIPPRLPAAAQAYVQSQSTMDANSPLLMSRAVEPVGATGKTYAKYAGRALAEWAVIVIECQSFFERRKNEGAPDNRHVETPTLGVEVLSSKRPS